MSALITIKTRILPRSPAGCHVVRTQKPVLGSVPSPTPQGGSGWGQPRSPANILQANDGSEKCASGAGDWEADEGSGRKRAASIP